MWIFHTIEICTILERFDPSIFLTLQKSLISILTGTSLPLLSAAEARFDFQIVFPSLLSPCLIPLFKVSKRFFLKKKKKRERDFSKYRFNLVTTLLKPAMPSVSSMTFEGLNELTVAYLLSLILAILAVCSNLELAPPGVSPRPKQMIHSHLSVP